MGLENGKGYSRQAYEDTEKGIKDVVDSIDASAPVEQLREKFAEQNELVGEKETLHNEAWDQAVAENTARDETKVSQEAQKAAEQSEAAELLKKMHENAGMSAKPVEHSEMQKATATQEQTAPVSVVPKVELGALGKASIAMKQMFGRKLTPEENAYHLENLSEGFTKNIKEGNLDKALKSYGDLNNERFQQRLSNEQFSKYKEEIDNLTAKAVATGDRKTFDKVLRFNLKQGLDNGPSFTKKDLGLEEGEVVSPEISKVATEHLSRIVKSSFSGNLNSGLENYKGRLDRWVESGVISRDEFNKLPLVRDAIKKEAVSIAKIMFGKDSNYRQTAERIDGFLEKIADTGVYSKEEVRSWRQIKRLTGY